MAKRRPKVDTSKRTAQTTPVDAEPTPDLREPHEASLEEFFEDPSNANNGTERGHAMLERSVRELGAGRSILVDKNGVVIAGNKTREAALNVGLKDAIIVETDGRKIVVVKRTDLDLLKGGAARQLAYADNRIAEVDLAWNPDALRKSLVDGTDLSMFFSQKEIVNLLAASGDEDGASVEDDEIPTTPEDPITRPGDVWRIGDVTLVCGDSTIAENVARSCDGEQAHIVWTDPPYNVDIGKGIRRREDRDRYLNNDNIGSDFGRFLDSAFGAVWNAMTPGAAIYVAMSSQEWPTTDSSLRARGFHWSTTIIWMKNSFVVSRRDFHSQYEPIWYGWRGDAPRIRPVAARDVGDTWEIPRPSRNDEHPTMKPVELVVRSLRYSSRKGDLVLDPFGGSGTTAIAATRLERRCGLVELDPKYCDVIVERLEKETGLKARR